MSLTLYEEIGRVGRVMRMLRFLFFSCISFLCSLAYSQLLYKAYKHPVTTFTYQLKDLQSFKILSISCPCLQWGGGITRCCDLPVCPFVRPFRTVRTRLSICLSYVPSSRTVLFRAVFTIEH